MCACYKNSNFVESLKSINLTCRKRIESVA